MSNESGEINDRLKKVIRFVAWANLIYFFIEFYFARSASSVSLFSDSIDFLEDAAINFLILWSVGWTGESRRKLSFVLAGLLLVPSSFAFVEIILKFFSQSVPTSSQMTSVGFGAFAVNLICSLLLMKYRSHQEGVVKAAFLSSRNDLLANVGIIAAGFFTVYWPTHWPDFIVGLAIFFLNFTAAKEVWGAARQGQTLPN